MTNYPSTPTIEIDPRGDVLLQTPTTSFLVASKCLTLASPVFSAMLHGHFLEASSLSTTGSVTISVDDDPEILCIIFNILHYRHRQVPSSLTSAQLLELAVVADKYDLADAIHPAYLTWRGDPKTMGVGPGVPAPARIFIAWVFRDREWFYVATRYTLLHCCLEEALEEGRWGGEGEVDEEDGFSDAREGKHDDEEEEDEEEPESEPYHDDPEQSTPTQSSPNQRRKRAPDQPPRKHGRLCIYNSLLSEMTPPIPDKVIASIALKRRSILHAISTYLWSLLTRYQSLTLSSSSTLDSRPVTLCQQVHSEPCNYLSIGYLLCLMTKSGLWENGKPRESHLSIGCVLKELEESIDMSHSLYGGHRGCGPRAVLVEYAREVERGMVTGCELEEFERVERR